MREIITDWATEAGGSQVSVMYFDSGVAASTQQAAVAAWAEALRPFGPTSTVSRVRNQGREIDPVTGTLTGTWVAGNVTTRAGSGGNVQGPDATQALIRWRTDNIVNGRFVKGRTFVPGLRATDVVGGNLATATASGILAAANALAAGVNGMVIWHRPNGASPGSQAPVVAASVWTELAVLRRRRR